MIMLAEIKTEIEPNESCWRSAGFDSCTFIPSIGRTGGLCLLWKNYKLVNEKIKITQLDERLLVMEHRNLEINFSCNIIFIYAPPQENAKDAFWALLTNLVLNLNLPSIIMGDFNEISCPSDKLGGVYPNKNRFLRINNIIQNCNLVDLDTRGNEFT